jgi:hypothetical protein
MMAIWFITSDDPKARTFAVILGIGLVLNKLQDLLNSVRQLRGEMELLKGSIRHNRFIEQSRHQRDDG